MVTKSNTLSRCALALGVSMSLWACGGDDAKEDGFNDGKLRSEGDGGSGGIDNIGGGPDLTGSGGGSLVGNKDPNLTSPDPTVDVNVCGSEAFANEASAVDMYIMLDQSSSMGDPMASDPTGPMKWTSVTQAMLAFFSDARASGMGVGIEYFGQQQTDDCNSAKYSTPDVAIGLMPGNAGALIQSVNAATGPSTFTPTYPALEGALIHAKQHATENPGRQTVVVLVTDGFPTECETSVSAISTLAEQYAQDDPPVLTFVIGLDGVSNLRSIAQRGGTKDAFIIDGGDVSQQFLDAMLNVTLTPLECEYDIPIVPDGQAVDPQVGGVWYQSPIRPKVQVPHVTTLGACNPSEGGWYYDLPVDPTRMIMCPATCDSLRAGTLEVAIACTAIGGQQ